MASPGPCDRLVLHLDLDAFYAAVEHRRLSIPLSEPLVVAQWVGIVAVGYAARAAGVVACPSRSCWTKILKSTWREK